MNVVASFLQTKWDGNLRTCGMVLAAVMIGMLIYWVLFSVLSRIANRDDSLLNAILVDRMRAPARMLLSLFAVILLLPSLTISAEMLDFVQHIFNISLIVLITWVVITITITSRDIIIRRYDIDAKESFKARAVYTQLTMAIKVILVIVVIIALASILMSFDKIRSIGVSILASAGIMGIIVGFAAQRTLATLLAGLQIAITQPIKINDVVIMEGEWGTIEEITLTYVVVKIWDLRRMIVPVTYFLEKSFQNWSRSSTNILGTVFLYVDYMAPVEEIRQKLLGILQASKTWDKDVWGLQVTNSGEHVLELRALMSAVDAPNSWKLRCEVREKLVAFLKEIYPECLPRTRTELIR